MHRKYRPGLLLLPAKISTQVNKNIFQTLQTTLTNFINNRKWTSDAFQANEKIQCNFLLNIEQELGNNVYKGKLDRTGGPTGL